MQLPDKISVEAWARLLKTHRLLLEQVETDLKTACLPPLSWYDVLYELKCAGPSGLRQYEISAQVLLSKHNLSRLLDRLQSKNLIRRESCVEDGRGTCVHITDTGVQALKNMWPVYATAIQTHFSGRLDSEEIQRLSDILFKLLAEEQIL